MDPSGPTVTAVVGGRGKPMNIATPPRSIVGRTRVCGPFVSCDRASDVTRQRDFDQG